MRRFLPALLASMAMTAAPLPGAAQTFEGVVTAKIHAAESAREPTEVTYALRGGVMRMEMAARGDVRSVIIVDTPAKTNYVLMPQQKMYMTMPYMAGAADAQAPPEIVRTGRKETIAGHVCEHWLVKDPSGDLDVCVASGLGAPFSMGGAGMGREPAWAGALRDQRGFPLKVARAGGATILEVTKVEAKKLDGALFAPPADYKKMEMPAGRPARPPRQ
jgi:hypothetical protein